jgi:hypothetical protein
MATLSSLFLLGLISGAALYFIPTMVAFYRNHTNCVAIFILNLLLGWTLLGWAGALIWACIHQEETEVNEW